MACGSRSAFQTARDSETHGQEPAGRSPEAGRTHSNAGDIESIFPFLACEVLEGLDAQAREFLMRVALLPTFTAEMAADLTGDRVSWLPAITGKRWAISLNRHAHLLASQARLATRGRALERIHGSTSSAVPDTAREKLVPPRRRFRRCPTAPWSTSLAALPPPTRGTPARRGAPPRRSVRRCRASRRKS
jgi:hypothetical protein